MTSSILANVRVFSKYLLNFLKAELVPTAHSHR